MHKFVSQVGFEQNVEQMCVFIIITKTIMHLVYPPPKFALSSISLGTTVIPRTNWRQWSRKILGSKKGVLWSL